MGKTIHGIQTGDLHWGHNCPEALYAELKKGLYKTIKDDKRIDYVVIDGDYFHKKLSSNDRPYQLAIKFFYELLTLCQKRNIKLRALRGTITHDFAQLDVFKAFESTHPCFRLINTVEVEELLPDVFVLFIPEEYPENQEEYYSEYFDLDEDSAYDLIIGHGTFKFQAWQNQVIESERPHRSAPVFDEKLMSDIAIGPIVFGHIHTPCDYRKKVFYHGSYTRDGMGEEEAKGFLFIEYDVEDGSFDVTFIENTEAPIYKTVNFDVIHDECGGDDVASIQEVFELKKTCHKLRIRYEKKTDDEQSVARAELLREHFASVSDIEVLEKKTSNIVAESDEDIDVLLEDEVEVNELAFLLEEGGDIALNIRDFLSIKFGIDYHKDDITDAITVRKDTDKDEE
jgi:hypothetical protein